MTSQYKLNKKLKELEYILIKTHLELAKKKDEKKALNKEYYLEHREKQLKYANEPVICECGEITTKANKHHHIKTTDHLNQIRIRQLEELLKSTRDVNYLLIKNL